MLAELLGNSYPAGLILDAELHAASIAEQSFAGLIDTEALSNDPAVIDRLSRAREFDIGGYKSLTSAGEYGRVGDGLDSDEALQNLYFRERLGVERHDASISGNPAIALSRRIHSMIRNLRADDLPGMTAMQVLSHHMTEMRRTQEVPDFVMVVLERESIRFIQQRGVN